MRRMGAAKNLIGNLNIGFNLSHYIDLMIFKRASLSLINAVLFKNKRGINYREGRFIDYDRNNDKDEAINYYPLLKTI